jgi:hypothetical protein
VTQNSYPKAAVEDEGLSDHHWKHLMLPLGRGVIDLGGSPYRMAARDSVTNTVTIGVDTRHGENFAILDGFLHHMDAPEQVSVPAVTTDTVYEIGLEYDPQAHAADKGPVTLKAWVAPPDTSQQKSHLVLYRMTRKNNLALGATPYTAEVPRAVPVISVSQRSQLPTNSLVMVDTLGVIRTTGDIFRADISSTGTVTWSPLSGNDASAQINAAIDNALGKDWKAATALDVGNSIVRRWPDGVIRVGDSIVNPKDALNVGTADSRYRRLGTEIEGFYITANENMPIPNEVVTGSTRAWKTTNLGSTWSTVAMNSAGRFGKYPSALKYKKNVRGWNPDPRTILAMEPVQYDVRTDVAGASEGSDKGLIGFVADSYVETRRELVLVENGEVEGFHYHLMPVAQQVVLRYLDRERRRQADEIADLKRENERLAFNQNEILAYLGLNTDADGRVIIEGQIVPDNGSEA